MTNEELQKVLDEQSAVSERMHEETGAPLVTVPRPGGMKTDKPDMQQNKPAERPDGPLRFRKKPVVIEAMQFTEESKNRVFHWITCSCAPRVDEDGKPTLLIATLEGDHLARLGDWIIKGVKGEFYPIKSDIFEETYRPADEPAPRDAACPVSAQELRDMALDPEWHANVLSKEDEEKLRKLAAWLEQREAR